MGTSSVKLLLVGEKGEILCEISRTYPIEFPQSGWSQQSPADWVTGMEDALEDLLRYCDPADISGIGIGGQMHGLVVLDKEDNVIRPAILWNDGRTAEETEWLNNHVGKEKLTRLTGNIAFAGFTAPKILWMKKNEPENFKKIHKIMLPKDYLVYVLSGAFTSDPSDASGTLFYDVANRCWSKEMLEICGISETQLPRVHESSEPVGVLRPEVCERFGFRTDTVVCAGAGDNAAAAVGCGVIGDGNCNISLGTSGTIFITSNKYSVDNNNALHSFAHADGSWHQMGCILSAASCNKWWMDILGSTDYVAEQECIKNLGKNTVYYLPYLMASAVRTMTQMQDRAL